MANSHEPTILLYKASLQKLSSRFPDVPIRERDQRKVDQKRKQEGGSVGQQRVGRYDTGEKVIDNKYHLLFNWKDFLSENSEYGIGRSLHIFKQASYGKKHHSGQPKHVLVVPIVKKEYSVPIGNTTIINDQGLLDQISEEDYEKTIKVMMIRWKYTHGWNNQRIERVSTYNVSNFDGGYGNYNWDDHEELSQEELFELFDLNQRIELLEAA